VSAPSARRPGSPAPALTFDLPRDHEGELRLLPWSSPLETWSPRRVHLLNVKSGPSRHIVRFVQAGAQRYAIKETSGENARRELDLYRRLHAIGIPALKPVGVVVRDDGTATIRTAVGMQRWERRTGYLVTALMEKVLPDSFLFRRAFSRHNRNRIWDAVVRLFVDLHIHGVYWGDASLANMLIHFSSEPLPEIGRRARLKAVLADAETAEIHHAISDRLRQADVDFFFESMLWNEEDQRALGVVRDPIVSQDDRAYLQAEYDKRFGLELEMRSFELVTNIDVDRLLGDFNAAGDGKLLLKHIQEHKWYLSEHLGREVQLAVAANDWYAQVFRPVCRLFGAYGLPSCFPDRSASRLYLDIMEHKYYMSQKEQRDIGLPSALRDYVARFSDRQPEQGIFRELAGILRRMFRSHQGATGELFDEQ
jgi:hypothetical protein